MPLNYSIFDQARNGGNGPATLVNASARGPGPVGAHGVLAASTASAAITGPCLLLLIPDEDARVIVQKGSAPGADPAATGMKLIAGGERAFDLGNGQWFLRWIAG